MPTSPYRAMGHRPISQYAVPPEAWDTHMHVTDLDRFPSAKTSKADYKPHASTIEGARQNAARLAVPNLAFVQPSTYGTDNSCLLWCLQQMEPGHGRGVIVIDPKQVSREQLAAWHQAGVRGVRVNLKSVGSNPSAAELKSLLQEVDMTIAPMKTWAIHIYADSSYMQMLLEVVGDLKSKICIDHMGSPEPGTLGPQIGESPSWQALKRMLDSEQVFVKVSAPYRFLDPGKWAKLEVPVKQLLECRSGRAAVFASDWPHTRFENTDIKPWVDYCLDWCGSDASLQFKFFRGNAERLYDATSSPS